MTLFHSSYRRSFLVTALWLAASQPTFAQPARVIAKPSTPTVADRTAAAPKVEPLEPAGQPMPDDGPRAEGRLTGIDGLAWQEGQAAYRKLDWADARRHFETILKQHPDSPQTPSAIAFVTEVSLQQDGSRQTRSEAIQTYKKLIREYPQSHNARRAEWRIADLYLVQGWLQEAQAAYEQAMAHSLHHPSDGNRALLGVGYTFMAMRKWTDAAHAFTTLRKRTDHDLLAQRATIGLAHALYRQRRLADAQVMYEAGYRRWPKLFRLDTLAIQRFALTQVALHHEASSREIMLLLYNLYPRHEFAPSALLHVADSMVATSQPALAEFFYALTSSRYPDTTQDTIAQMRVVTLRADRMLPAGQNWIGLTVSALLHEVAIPDQTDAALRSTLQAIATEHADDSVGSEALFQLGRYYESAGDMSHALGMYKDAASRSGPLDDPWPLKASQRLSTILKPWLEAALNSHDDLTVVTLFHRHGPIADQLYAHSPLLLRIADAHQRLGFSLEAVRLYQQLTKTKETALLEPTLLGLGKTYLDQQDPLAARKVLERYRFQFPGGRYASEALSLLVTALQRLQDRQGLLNLCRTWLIHNPKHPERARMYLQLATTLGDLEKLEESALAYQEAFKAGASRSPEVSLAYADTLSQLNRHEPAIAAYQAALDTHPTVRQAEWAHLQIARQWTALKQYDRATIALAELGMTEDPLINRFSSSFKGSLQTARRPENGEGL